MTVLDTIKARFTTPPASVDSPEFVAFLNWARHPWDGPLDVTKAPPKRTLPPDMDYVKRELPNLYAYLTGTHS